MTANERRVEIMRIMTARRQESMGRLALELGVTRRTIRSDITALTVDYPLETQRGNGGCVKVADWYPRGYRPARGGGFHEHHRRLLQKADP